MTTDVACRCWCCGFCALCCRVNRAYRMQASRDNKSLMIVRYSDLKKAMGGAFTDLAVTAAAARQAERADGGGYDGGGGGGYGA